MSYLLAQILVCLVIAGLIGAVIGWFLRGGCSRKLRDCEDEWKMKMGALESEYTSKRKTKNDSKALQEETLKRHEEHVQTQTPSYSYEKELKNQLDQAQHGLKSEVNNSVGFDLNSTKQFLLSKGVSLSDEKIKLYRENGVDFDTSNNLEENYYIETIEGIDATHAASLREMGIKTTQDLVKKLHKNNAASDQVAKALKIEPSSLSSWISMADLIQLPGVDSKSAQLMQTVGISTARELGITNPTSLHHEMLAFNKKTPIVSEVPSITSLTQWSKIAKLLG